MAELAFPKLPLLASLPRLRKKQRPRVQGQVTALDVDGSTLRVVQASPDGDRISVTRIVAQRLEFAAEADRSDPNVLGAAIARALAELSLKPGPVVMGVPRAQVRAAQQGLGRSVSRDAGARSWVSAHRDRRVQR